jgi:hypothetical protein
MQFNRELTTKSNLESARRRSWSSPSSAKCFKSKEATVRIGEQEFAVKHRATKWLGFCLDPKLSFKTHFAKRLTSPRGALQKIKGLSGSHGGLPMRHVRRVVVATVNSIALYGAEV